MKKLLVLFTKEFPYGVSEPFLEAEYPLYKEYFDKVLIVTNRPTATGRRGMKTREVNDPAVEIIESEFNKNLFKKLSMVWNVVTDINTYIEMFRILTKHKANFYAMRSLLSSIGKANLCVKLAHKRVKELEADDYKVVGAYAYWLIYPAYSAVKFSKKYYNGKLYTVSRAHRFDLYEDRNAGNYIPCRNYILGGLSEIASISDDGVNYLKRTHPNLNMNITVHHLGAKDVGFMKKVDNNEKVFKIVSCARTVPVKRIDRIIDALSEINDINIEWTHCGGGDLLDDIKTKSKTLPKNIKCIFTDTIHNTEVYELYRNNDYHVFLNVSQSEGVPVSIMEAMSFGLPIIATAVGGVPEMIISGENGYLLEEEYQDETLVSYIKEIHDMSSEDYSRMREKARKMFATSYNAIPNYRHFLENIVEFGGNAGG